MSMKERYLEEYEKFKHIEIAPGLYSQNGIEFEIVSVDNEKDCATIKTIKSGVIKVKTLHWCRKKLIKKDV